MFKPKVTAAEAASPYNTYDSILEVPSGTDPNQNAWLTLQLRIKLKFADSKNQVLGLTVKRGETWYAKDADGYLFPLLDWPAHLIARFQREFLQVAQRTWNYQYVLITPANYSGLDFPAKVGDLTIRPNVLCLFRLSLLNSAGTPIDNTPAAGPLRSGVAHRTINIVNLSLATRSVSLDTGVTAGPGKPAVRPLTTVDGLAWRSNADNYDDSDLFNPTWENKEHKVLSNTVGHEIGHALGQCHVMGLKGIPAYAFGGPNANDPGAWCRLARPTRRVEHHGPGLPPLSVKRGVLEGEDRNPHQHDFEPVGCHRRHGNSNAQDAGRPHEPGTSAGFVVKASHV